MLLLLQQLPRVLWMSLQQMRQPWPWREYPPLPYRIHHRLPTVLSLTDAGYRPTYDVSVPRDIPIDHSDAQRLPWHNSISAVWPVPTKKGGSFLESALRRVHTNTDHNQQSHKSDRPTMFLAWRIHNRKHRPGRHGHADCGCCSVSLSMCRRDKRTGPAMVVDAPDCGNRRHRHKHCYTVCLMVSVVGPQMWVGRGVCTLDMMVSGIQMECHCDPGD